MTAPAQHPGRPTASSVATFVLSLLTSAAALTVAVLWSPIDAEFVTRADEAGWDTSLLLPHQELLTLASYGAVVLSLTLTVVALRAVSASRRCPAPIRPTVDVDAPRVWTA